MPEKPQQENIANSFLIMKFIYMTIYIRIDIYDVNFQVPVVYEEMISSGCTPDRKAREMLRSALKYMKEMLKW